MIFILGAAMYRLQGSLSFATGVGKEPRRLAAARRPLPPVPTKLIQQIVLTVT